jgi:hypothetical protein
MPELFHLLSGVVAIPGSLSAASEHKAQSVGRFWMSSALSLFSYT